MDSAIIAAVLTGLAGLIGLFFGRHYWAMLNNLVTSQQREIERLQKLVRELRDRLDRLESDLYQKALELQETMGNLDNYIVSSQNLLLENQQLRTENERLKSGLVGQNVGQSP